MGPSQAARTLLALSLASAAAGCGGHGAAPSRSASGASLPGFQVPGLRGADEPMVRGARLLPASLEEARAWGSEPGGGVRAVIAGLRIVSSPGGEIAVSRDRLGSNPSTVLDVPERLGGGFLFVVGTHVWRSPSWLGPATPIFTTAAPVTDLYVGLDRAYVRGQQGPLLAFDPRSGADLDLGPLPASPRVFSIAAIDAWRAVAVADLRGTLVTLDAGSSWNQLSLPVEPSKAVPMGGADDGFAVVGYDRGRSLQWWQVLPDGQTGWLAAPPPVQGVTRTFPGEGSPPLGSRALQAAVEDGWPLSDGSAVVARDGFLLRVRLLDGAVLETIADAFPLRPARCHPLSLARPADRGAFGFACGEPRGPTAIYRWDADGSRLAELRRFDDPREVLASGNGALAVRGGCDAAAAGDAQAWCSMRPGGGWSEVRLTGARAEQARVVVLGDGRVALVRPPVEGDLSTARVSLLGAAASDDLPLRLPELAPEVARALRFGVWLDGFEERRPGVLGGWVDAAGSVLGVEIELDARGGELRPGEYIREAGAPVASGRWAFGWTASRGGFETTDGGMSWTKEIALPEPIAEPRAGRDRSCSPVGCVSSGWLRLGWGRAPAPVPLEPPPPRPRPFQRASSLVLDCQEAASRPPPDPPAPSAARPAIAHGRSSHGMITSAALSVFRSFAGRAGPPIEAGEVGLSIDASLPFERSVIARPVARGYAWGPGTGDWGESPGRWQVRWLWPWGPADGGGSDARSSSASPAPWHSLELAARALGSPLGTNPDWTLIPGDDPDHALLVERRAAMGTPVATNPGTVAVEVLESDRPALEVKRVGGLELPDLQGAVRSGGRWYVATAQPSGDLAATVLWVIDGAVAREVGRVPRVAPETGGPLRLARRVGGAASVALVATAQDPDRASVLWASRFDPEARSFADPEPLAAVDLTDRPAGVCGGDDAGWEVEGLYPGAVDVHVGAAAGADGWTSRLQGAMARLRLTRGGACVDRVFGSAVAVSPDGAGAPLVRSDQSGPSPVGTPTAVRDTRALPVTVVRGQGREWLRCRLISP